MRPTVAVKHYGNIVGVGALDDPQRKLDDPKMQNAELMSGFVTFIYPCRRHTIFLLYSLFFILLHGRFVKRPYIIKDFCSKHKKYSIVSVNFVKF